MYTEKPRPSSPESRVFVTKEHVLSSPGSSKSVLGFPHSGVCPARKNSTYFDLSQKSD